MRIGIDARKLHDFGIGTYIRNLLRELAKIDQTTEYVRLTRPQDMSVAASLGENFRAVADPLRALLARRTDFDSAGGEAREARSLSRAALRAARADAVAKRRHDSRLHSPDVPAVPSTPSLGYAFARASLYTAAHKSDRIFTVSEQSKRDILKFFNVPPDKIVVTPNAIDDRFSVPPSEEHVVNTRERYQLSHSYLLYVGNIKPHKNLERLIEAFHLVRQQGRSELELIIIGDEISKLQSLRRAVHKYDIHRYVRFLGYVPDKTLAVLYRLASVFVFPSLYEGFGLPPLEAMASGTPVVTSNVSSLPEVVGDAAVLVDPYSAEAIADGIIRVLRSTHLREDLRRRGLERVKDYSWARSVKRVREIYGEVLRR